MLFANQVYLFILMPIGIIVHLLLSKTTVARNIWLLCFSIGFLAWIDPAIVSFILFTWIICWLFGLWIEKASGKKKKVMMVGLTLLLLLLLVCKFFYGLQDMLPKFAEHFTHQIMIPVGYLLLVSRGISYIMDVYRGDAIVAKNPINIGMYLSFFPFFLPASFVRYEEFEVQIAERQLSIRKLSLGLCRLIVGLSKVILIGNSLAVVSDTIFNYSTMGQNLVSLSALSCFLGLLAFCLQIYFSLSGSADMAIGISSMLGFKIAENFEYPYASFSLHDFWNRWCVTYYKSFQTYLGVDMAWSLNQNRDVDVAKYFGVFLLYALWLGSQINFILMGVWNASLLILEQFLRKEISAIPKWIRRTIVLVNLLITMILWRSPDLYQAGQFFANLFCLNSNSIVDPFSIFIIKEYAAFFIAGILFALPIAPKMNTWLVQEEGRGIRSVLHALYPIAMIVLLFMNVVFMIKLNYQPYMYFNY